MFACPIPTPASSRPVGHKATLTTDVDTREGWDLDSHVEAVNPEALALMRRCGIELNEAQFLLDAAFGDIRAAEELQRGCEKWAGPIHTTGGKLTGASYLAMAHASPPSSVPESPLEAVLWPTVAEGVMKTAAASEDKDWDFLLSNKASAGLGDEEEEDWVEIDDEDMSGTRPTCKPEVVLTFNDIARKLSAGESEGAATAATGVPLFVAKPPEHKLGNAFVCDAAPSGALEDFADQFEFDEDIAMKSRRRRDGHSKNSKKGCRQATKSKQARALKNSGKTR